jgi:hypothetical protein
MIKRIMKKLVLLIIMLMLALGFAFFAVAASEENAESGIPGGLELDPGIIDQRENENGQTTNGLDIEILTPDSEQLEDDIKQSEDEQLSDTKDGLFTGKYDGETEDGGSNTPSWLFGESKGYYGVGSETNGINWVTVVIYSIAAAVLIAVSYFGATAFRKRRHN